MRYSLSRIWLKGVAGKTIPAIIREVEIMPFVNEYSCRLLDPKKIAKVGCRSMDRTHEDRRYRAIICKFYDTTKWLIQSLRYPVDQWTRSQAIAHCREYEGQFEDIKQPEETRKMELSPGQFVRKMETIKTDSGLWYRPAPILKYEKGRCIPYAKYPCREAEWEGVKERSKFELPGEKDRLIKAVAYVFEPGEKLTDFIPPHHYHSDLAVSKSAVRHTLGVLQGARGGYSRLSDQGYGCVYRHMIKHCKDCEIEFSDPKPEWGVSQKEVESCQWWLKE